MTNLPNFNEPDSCNIGKPSSAEYEKAKNDYKMFCSWIVKSRERKNELIDALIIERENEKTYTELADKQKDIIRRYEIYTELEAKQNS